MPFPAIAAFSFAKLLKPKNLLYVAGAVLIGFVLYKGYNWIYDRGVQAEQLRTERTIKKLTDERNIAVNKFKEYKGQYDDWVQNSKVAKEQFIREQAQTIANLEKSLAASNQRANDKKVIIREVAKYIPAEVDGSVVLPFGFVRMYAESLQGAAATDASLGAVSFGPQGNVGAPSGITLSQFADIAVTNNLNCVRYRERLTLWQTWYPATKTQYDAAIKVQAESVPTNPDAADLADPQP